MIFFTDENISRNAAYILNIFDREHEIRACVDYFEQGTPDIEWMKVVASWNESETTVVVCGDGRILKNKVQKQVLKECQLMFIFLSRGWTTLEWPVFAWKIIKAWPDVVKNVKHARYPMVFEVAVNTLKIEARGRISHL